MMQFFNFPGFSGFRAGGKNGGEYQGKCPGNGPDCVSLEENTDRMRVWPLQGNVGTFSCRKCGRGGDAIQWLRDFQGLGYIEACSYLGIEPKTQAKASVPGRSSAPRPVLEQSRKITIHPTTSPSPVWIEHAEKFVSWCHEQLLANQEQLDYLASRGITQEAAIDCRLGWNPTDTYRARESWGLPTELHGQTGKAKRLWLPSGLVIPVYRGGVLHRIRIRRPDYERAKNCENLKYYRIPGSAGTTMILGESARAFAVVEAELDAVAIFAAAADLVGAVSIETLEGNLDAEAYALLFGSLAIIDALDADDPKTPALQRALAKWSATFDRHLRWPVPVGKDPGEAFKAGVDLRAWIKAGLPPVFQIGSGTPDRPGQSLSSGLVEGAADVEAVAVEAITASDEVEKKETVVAAPASGDDLAELAGLLANTPVRVIKSQDPCEVRIKWTPAWRSANLAAAARISDLVFKSEAVGKAIHYHPAKEIHAGNLIQGG
ncbi:MAG: hypothetical protein KKH22_06695 [Proteobacteria bacterium]|nr:hypothetical protein [Pseudomonadota bacterium]